MPCAVVSVIAELSVENFVPLGNPSHGSWGVRNLNISKAKYEHTLKISLKICTFCVILRTEYCIVQTDPIAFG